MCIVLSSGVQLYTTTGVLQYFVGNGSRDSVALSYRHTVTPTSFELRTLHVIHTPSMQQFNDEATGYKYLCCHLLQVCIYAYLPPATSRWVSRTSFLTCDLSDTTSHHIYAYLVCCFCSLLIAYTSTSLFLSKDRHLVGGEDSSSVENHAATISGVSHVTASSAIRLVL